MARVIVLPGGRRIPHPDEVPEGRREEYLRELDALYALYEANPLERFFPHPCRHCKQWCWPESNPDCAEHAEPQAAFLGATSKIQAAFTGNRFGKTTALVVKALCQHAPEHLLPSHLAHVRRTNTDQPTMGRILVPSEKAFVEYTEPAFKLWTPKEMLRGGSWDKAYDKKFGILYFVSGLGQIGFYTYKQEPETMVGADLDYVIYDEPAPEAHRKECLIRLVDRDGFEAFGMTPVNIKGGGIGWIFRKILKRREDPKVTVVRASIYDNPGLTAAAIEAALEEYPEEERPARELGEFLHFGGMVYAGGFDSHLRPPFAAEDVKGLDVVVGIDPGLKNAAFIWVGFDNDNRAAVFHEALLQERYPKDYVRVLKEGNARFGIKNPLYVIDPTAARRDIATGERVETLLNREGIYCVHGTNDIQVGVQEIRQRLHDNGIFFGENLHGLRSEADEYRMEDRPDGEFEVVDENDHRLDALRYAVMTRIWAPLREQERARDRLGFRDGMASLPQPNREYGPMGSFA